MLSGEWFAWPVRPGSTSRGACRRPWSTHFRLPSSLCPTLTRQSRPMARGALVGLAWQLLPRRERWGHSLGCHILLSTAMQSVVLQAHQCAMGPCAALVRSLPLCERLTSARSGQCNVEWVFTQRRSQPRSHQKRDELCGLHPGALLTCRLLGCAQWRRPSCAVLPKSLWWADTCCPILQGDMLAQRLADEPFHFTR